MTTMTVSSKYQVVIPKELREKLGIRPGTRLQAMPEGTDAIRLVKEPTLDEVRELLRGMAWEESEVREEEDCDLP
jgi:AbrB family looped-hinge helix DNA binding protein